MNKTFTHTRTLFIRMCIHIHAYIDNWWIWERNQHPQRFFFWYITVNSQISGPPPQKPSHAIWHAHCVQIKLNNSIMLCGPHFYPIPCPNCASHAIPNSSVLHSVHELTTCQHIQKTLSQNLIEIVYTSMT